MSGWICGESNLDYPKIWIKMARINWSRESVKSGQYLDKIIIICRRKVKTSTKIRGKEKLNLPNKAHDTCWDFTFNLSLKEN